MPDEFAPVSPGGRTSAPEATASVPRSLTPTSRAACADALGTLPAGATPSHRLDRWLVEADVRWMVEAFGE